MIILRKRGHILKNNLRFNLFTGIILVVSGLNLLYLFILSHSVNLVLVIVNIIFGIILIISYRFPELFSRYNISKKQSQEITEYNKILKLNSKDTTAWNNKGTVFAKIGRYQVAIKCFDKALEIDPIDDDNWIINEKHLL